MSTGRIEKLDLWQWLSNAGRAFKEGWAWGGIYEAHRKAGHPNPRYAAEMEIHIRGEYFERFRDLASDAYLRDGTDLEEVKKDFIKDRLSAKTTVMDTQMTAATRAIVRDMPPSEAYHEDALRKYRADMDRYLKDVLAQHEQLHGKGGYSTLERRVLRGRGLVQQR